MIDKTNEMYSMKGMGIINKVPTPWNVTYNKKTGRVIKAFPEKKSTVDFVGVSHGRSIAFDAKSTNNRTSFPLKNIQEHQLQYLKKHQDQGGISFFLVEFVKLGEVYYLPFDDAFDWWKKAENGGRKSIPYQWFVERCELVRSGRGVVLDYLKICIG